MVYLRIILLLYVFPLMLISAFTFIFGKTEWIKYVWLYGTLAVILMIIVVKILFSLVGLVE